MANSMADAFDIVIVGGGIAGVSLAAALAPHARIAVLEREARPGCHATSRASPITMTSYGPMPMKALTAASEPFLAAGHDEVAGAPLLSPRGMVIVGRPDQMEVLRLGREKLERLEIARWLEPGEIELRVPILRRGYAAGGLLEAQARDINVTRLQQLYHRKLEAAGGRIVLGAEVLSLTRRSGIWEIETEGGHFVAPLVVNAAGAWAGQIGVMAGARPTGLTALRRSGVYLPVPAGLAPDSLPMVVDVDEQFYIKPEGRRLLASLAEETPVLPGDARADPLDLTLCVDRIMAAFDLPAGVPDTPWAGLRSFVPDRLPVVGFDPDVGGFFWLAGHGGMGIQTAPALSGMAAALIRGQPIDPELEARGIRPGLFAPDRLGVPEMKSGT